MPKRENCGVTIDGRHPKSKKEVKDAVASGDRVQFYTTSAFSNSQIWDAGEVPDNVIIDFVGPDPFNSRKFYGVAQQVNGKLVIK